MRIMMMSNEMRIMSVRPSVRLLNTSFVTNETMMCPDIYTARKIT